MIEEYRIIPEFPNYEVSNTGNVRNIRTQRILKPVKSPMYLSVKLGAGNRRYIHRLVMAAFVGPADDRIVRHKDNNPLNNSLSNLEYGSLKDNTYDRIRHDTWSPKLNKRKVKIIRGLHKCGFKTRRLSEMFNVGMLCIQRIINGTTWKHLAP